MFSTVKGHQVLLDLQELQAQQELQDKRDCPDEMGTQDPQVLKVNAALPALGVWQDLEHWQALSTPGGVERHVQATHL